jgi:sulfur carrier protein
MSRVAFTANGKPRQAAYGSSIAEVLGDFGLDPALVVVEYNGEPLDRARFATTGVRDGDRIEIAQMVGGG